IWLPEMYKIADLPAIPVNINIEPKKSQVVTVSPALPEKFGGYALIFDLGQHGRVFGTTCVRTFAATTERLQYPKFSLDDVVGVPVLNRLGVQAIRRETGFHRKSDPDYEKQMAKLEEELNEYAKNNITVLLTLEAGRNDIMPLGRGRPHLNADGVMLNTKQDLAWLPQYDAEYRVYVADLCRKFGWPKGPVTAVQLWNEPWEGISISGWGADMLRYREIYTAMALGVEDARKDGADVLITGCDSSTNSNDKLFGDGKDDFLKWYDACTIHYQGLTSPVLFRKWHDRQGPNGRVKVWDTESWVANTDDRVASIVASNRAAGYDRSMGIFHGNISTRVRARVTLPDGTQKQTQTIHAWSTAAAIGATQHFIGERNFRELLFKNGLPWVMVFDGDQGTADDGTVVIVGDLKEAYDTHTTLFRGVRGMAEIKHKEALAAQLAALSADAPERAALLKQLAVIEVLRDATLTLANPDKEFIAFDYYGNPLPVGGTISVPLNSTGNFLRTNGAPGSFERLVKAIAAAAVSGIEPLNVAAHDLTAPVGSKPALRLTLTNILNRPVAGALTVSLGKLALDVPAKLDFKAGETKHVLIPVTGGEAATDNTYPLTFKFDAGADGYTTHQENLHVNYIAKHTVSVDGNLDDWKDILPLPVIASGDQGPSLMEAAWLPMVKFDVTQKPGFAIGHLAYDDQYLYFAVKIADNSPDPGTLRFATANADDNFYPAVAREYDPDKTILQQEENWAYWKDVREHSALFLPGSKTERSFVAWVPSAKQIGVDLELPADTTKLVSLYFVDWDAYQQGRRNNKIEVRDLATDDVLVTTNLKEYGQGAYLTFRVSGKIRIVVKPNNWTSTSLSGVFLDPDPAAKKTDGTSAELVGEDWETGANWAAKYGRDGHRIAGAAAQLPAYGSVVPAEVIVKQDYAWPEGVRRYSYRQRPVLPFGSAPKFDNVQLAFNVIPSDQKPDMYPFPPGTMDNFIPRADTDYEYALNKVADAHGGGTEIWRSFAPGMPRKHFYPRQPASPQDGAVKDGQLAINYDGNTRIVEAAIPWTEIPLVKKAVDEGQTVKFSFRVNDNQG
ncbi:MAG: hypothetical protein LBK76_06515, partial [Verrucomicrobiales bacterium]|nr:hypothetical protein [Verrucomicrobiales bacterium]